MTAEAATADARGAELVRRARAWIGTPYRHQASCRGAGTDCLGLILGLWREQFGQEPEAVPAYTADWAEPAAREDLLAAAGRHLSVLSTEDARPGDVLVLRMHPMAIAKHMGVLAAAPEGHRTLIHAYSGHGVVESPLTPVWQRRIAGAFRFPDWSR